MKKLIEMIKTYWWVFLLFQIPFIILSLFLGWEIIPLMNACAILFGIVLPFVFKIFDKLTPAEAIGRIIGRYWYVFLALIILIILLNN